MNQLKTDPRFQVLAFMRMYGFGEKEALWYIKALECDDKVKFFGPMARDARIDNDLLPWNSEAYLREYPTYRFVPVVNRGWWRWIEDFRPDDGIEPHRYLFDPFADVWDVQKLRESVGRIRSDRKLRALCFEAYMPPTHNTETGYIRYLFDRVDKNGKKVKHPVSLTRSRLIAYRYPHLVWRDYMRERYEMESFLAAPEDTLRSVMGLDAKGFHQSSGMYHPYLNDVVKREQNGKVKTTHPKGPSGAGTRCACVVMEIDHINRDHTDDRPTNLRITDRMGNLLNSQDAGFRNRGFWLRSQYIHSLQTGVLPAVQIVN
ncbi:hypothetical protein KCT11_004967 [Escherichia coli]|nr:hypothetical protein [Escherichia coli]